MNVASVRPTRLRSAIILAAGIAVREAFSFWTGHPFDFELWVRTGYWVAHGISPYGVLGPVPGLTFSFVFSSSAESTIGYLPFWPLLLGGIYQLYALVGGGDKFVYYFLLKQPTIVGDVLLGFAISRFVRNYRPKFANKVLALWLFSPFTIILSGIWGMFDSIAMVPVVLALSVKRETARSALEGLAVWIKSIPLVLAVPIAFSGRNGLRNIVISLFLPVAASIAVILLAGWPLATAFATLQSTASKGGQSLSAVGVVYYLIQLNLVGNFSPLDMKAIGYIWVPAVLAATYLGYRWHGFTTEKGLVQSLLLCTIAFLLFKAQVNEQYAIYVLALALVDLSWNPSRKWLYLLITAADMVFLLVNNALLVRFTSPVYPDWGYTEAMLDRAMGQWKTNLELASALVFVALNVSYFVVIYRSRSTGAQPN
jgi:hypothetical protein